MACSFFLYAASGLLVPWWAWVLLALIWLVLLPSTLREWDTAPRRPALVGAVSLGIWVVVVLGGGLLFGWEPWWGAVDWFG